MKVSHKKVTLLSMLLATALLLSGCYIENDATKTDGNTLNVDGVPFETIAPTVAPTPTPTPSPTPRTDSGTDANNNLDNINWDDGDAWGETATNLPSGNGIVITVPPSGNQSGQSGNQGTTTITASPTPTRTASTSGTSSASSGVLKAGATGTEVSEVQQRLKDLKYYTGSVDGSYGSGTTSAVKAFQEANGLTVDGIVGAKTKEKLFSYYAVASSGATPKPASATVKPTATVKPVTATPKKTYLEVGMSGADVRLLQNRLIELGYLTGKADGDYGASTEAAVKAFQKRNGTYDDGKAGPETQKLLFASTAKKASSAVSYVGDTLELGAEGDAVRALQNRLITLKYMSGYSDGSYGAKTKSAVEAFQKNNGLTVDGKAGKATLDALYGSNPVDAKGNGGATSSSSTSGSSTGYTTLQEGDEGTGVTKLQQRLKELGYYSGTVDGKFGSGTLSAVRAFQSAMKLTVDGKAGPATQRALYGTNAQAQDTSKTLSLGSEGSAVTSLQYALYELGYYQDTINGIYTQNTANAVREFQMINGLSPVDGIAGSATQALLYSPLAKSSQSET